MTNNLLINKCINKATLLKNNSKAEISKNSIENVENKLDISFPEDFKILCTFYGYDFFRYASFFNFCMDEGVINETLILRKEYTLPNNYLLLAEEDPGPILMRITSSGNAEVIMCSYGDFLNICDGKPYEEDPTIFPTFADFYEFLLDEEEKMRAEEKARSNS